MTTSSDPTDRDANRRVKLDAIDRRILRNLRDDGRMTNVELARLSGISAPPCLRRVRALESAGYIKGYHAELDGELLGYEVFFHAFVGLDSRAGDVLADFSGHPRDQAKIRRAGRRSAFETRSTFAPQHEVRILLHLNGSGSRVGENQAGEIPRYLKRTETIS